MRPSLLTLALAGFSLMPDAVMAGCGEAGGPGYRAPNGRCVGWASLARTCGDPPGTRCKFEGDGNASEARAQSFIDAHTAGRTRGGARPEFGPAHAPARHFGRERAN